MNGRRALLAFALALGVAAAAVAFNGKYVLAVLLAVASLAGFALALQRRRPVRQANMRKHEALARHPVLWTLYQFVAVACIVSVVSVTLLEGSAFGVIIGVAVGLYVALVFRHRLSVSR